MIKQQTINLEVFHFEFKFNRNFTFTVSFWGKRENGSDNNRTKVNMTFSLSWLRFFRREINKTKEKAQEFLDDNC